MLEKRSTLLVSFLKEHGLAEPKSVEFAPLTDCRAKACFLNVEAQVRRAGGRMETGWLFWEHENVCLFTEAHAVWITPSGKRRDITPQRLPAGSRVLFLPEPEVAKKRGYSSHFKTILSTDPRIIAMEKFDDAILHAMAEHFAGIGNEIVIPGGLLNDMAKEIGLPEDVAAYIVGCRQKYYSVPA